MHSAADAVPAKQQQGEEPRFQEEGEYPLGRQRAAEDVADVAGVSRPVGAELELQHDAGGHAHGEGQREDFGPEARHLVVEVLARLEP
jgi:hypothetical protein